jgi:hypothetical protein
MLSSISAFFFDQDALPRERTGYPKQSGVYPYILTAAFFRILLNPVKKFSHVCVDARLCKQSLERGD